MLLCPHGKRGWSATRFSEVREAAFAGSTTTAPRNASSRSSPAGGSTSTIGEPLGQATAEGWDTGAQESRARGTASAFATGRSAPHRERTEAWTRRPGLRDGTVDVRARGPLDRAEMRGEVRSRAGMADSASVGVELAASGESGTRKKKAMETKTLPEIKKRAGEESRAMKTVTFQVPESKEKM